MNDQTTAPREREEIEMLLPWYVTGRLDAADRTRVENHLSRDAGLRRQLDLIRAERTEAISMNETLRAPSAGALDRLISSLPEQQPTLGARIASSGYYQAVVDFFTAPTARGVRLAAVAAAALFLLQAGLITTFLVRGDGGGTYQTASGATNGTGISAYVVFADDARLPAITDVLAGFDATIVDGPKSGGVYKVRIETADTSEAARSALLQRLAERRDVIRSVVPAGG